MLNYPTWHNFGTFFTEMALTSFYCDVFFLQIALVYSFFLLIYAPNVYYVMLYLFFQIAYFGLTISVLQLEIFTGFLWVTELTILFILLLLCFYLNAEGFFFLVTKKHFFFYTFIFFFSGFFFFFNHSTENAVLLIFNYVDIWDDFYESFDNKLMTDFFGLFLIYYYFNSFFTFIIFLLLFLASVVCVMLFKQTKVTKQANLGSFLSVFNYYQDAVSFLFYRRQTLSKQTSRVSATKVFKKKTLR